MRAARYLGVPLWELEARPLWYREHALGAMRAERDAEKIRERRRRPRR
jgi:hypothetical protein